MCNLLINCWTIPSFLALLWFQFLNSTKGNMTSTNTSQRIFPPAQHSSTPFQKRWLSSTQKKKAVSRTHRNSPPQDDERHKDISVFFFVSHLEKLMIFDKSNLIGSVQQVFWGIHVFVGIHVLIYIYISMKHLGRKLRNDVSFDLCLSSSFPELCRMFFVPSVAWKKTKKHRRVCFWVHHVSRYTPEI